MAESKVGGGRGGAASPVRARRRIGATAASVLVLALGGLLVGCGSGSGSRSDASGTAIESSSSGAGEEPGSSSLTDPCTSTAGGGCSTQAPANDTMEPIGPDGCGLEVLDCGSGTNPRPDDVGPAECTADSYREAVISDIDGGSFAISDERCDGTWAAFTVDRSRDACPASDDPQPGCAPGTRAHRTFWQNRDGHWRVITYGGTGDCTEVLAVAPEFPVDLCTP